MSRTTRRLVLAFVAGTAGVLVAHAVHGGDDWGRWLVITPVAGAIAAGLGLVRIRARDAVVEAAREQRRHDGLPVPEERSLGEEYRAHPVRTVLLVVLIVALFVGLFWWRIVT